MSDDFDDDDLSAEEIAQAHKACLDGADTITSVMQLIIKVVMLKMVVKRCDGMQYKPTMRLTSHMTRRRQELLVVLVI